jgi:hypothetical protein
MKTTKEVVRLVKLVAGLQRKKHYEVLEALLNEALLRLLRCEEEDIAQRRSDMQARTNGTGA